MRLRNEAIDSHVAGCRGEGNLHAFQVRLHLDLTSEPGQLGQGEGEIEHVILIVARLGETVEGGLVEVDVAGGAGETALAGALQIDVVGSYNFV